MLWRGLKPLLNLVDAAGIQLNFTHRHKEVLEVIRANNLLLAKTDNTSEWIPNAR